MCPHLVFFFCFFRPFSFFFGVPYDSEQQCLRGLHLHCHHHTPTFCPLYQTVLLLLFATTLLLQVLARTMSSSGPAVNEDYICSVQRSLFRLLCSSSASCHSSSSSGVTKNNERQWSGCKRGLHLSYIAAQRSIRRVGWGPKQRRKGCLVSPCFFFYALRLFFSPLASSSCPSPLLLAQVSVH